MKKFGHDNGKPEKDEDDDNQFLPETDQEAEEGEIHISPALRALMAKCVYFYTLRLHLLPTLPLGLKARREQIPGMAPVMKKR